MKILIILGKFFLNLIYTIFKIFPTQKKVIFVSRQSNKIPLDFKLIINELNKQNKYKIVVKCYRVSSVKDVKKEIFKFLFFNVNVMYHLATSKVCVIDSYCMPVSILHHKKSLKVMQIWHAMGKIKKSGYQTLDLEGGKSSKMAKLLNLHKNYSIVVAGASSWNKAYCQSFGINEDIIWNIGLPRAAHIYLNNQQIKNDIYKKYPIFKKKKVILYAPTFRTNNDGSVEKIIELFSNSEYALIVRCHPKQILNYNSKNVFKCEDINIYNLLTICDYFITDYSSLAVEAAAIKKKTLYYLYDYDQYLKTNGLNMDPLVEYPSLTYKNADDIKNIIINNKYDTKAFINYQKKYVPKDFEKATQKIAKCIKGWLNNE